MAEMIEIAAALIRFWLTVKNSDRSCSSLLRCVEVMTGAAKVSGRVQGGFRPDAMQAHCDRRRCPNSADGLQ